MSEELNKDGKVSGTGGRNADNLKVTSRTAFGLVLMLVLLLFGIASSVRRVFRDRSQDPGMAEMVRETVDSIRSSMGFSDTADAGGAVDTVSVNDE